MARSPSFPYIADTLSIAGPSALAEFVVDAKDALRFQLVRHPDEVVEVGVPEENNSGGDKSTKTFKAEMAHQVYGEQ